MLDLIQEYFREEEERPNKFTRFMGEKIKTAREEAGYSQDKLAKLCFLRRATLSNIENGKSEADIQTFLLIAYYLKKPLAYFLPEFMYKEIKQEDLNPLEQEALFHFEKIRGYELQKLTISIIRAFAEFDPENLVIELAPYVKNRLEIEEERHKRREK